jgi:HAD superfamily hydrolase (TIGR01484 family)
MKYKALFLDVDGTTVVHGIDNLPSPSVTAAVQACERMGVRVSLATSRPPRSVVRIIEHLSLSGYCVLSSGSQIYDPEKKKVIIEQRFPKSAMVHVIQVARDLQVKVSIYDGEKEFFYDGVHPPEKIVGMWFPEITPETLQTITKRLTGVSGISLHRMDAWDPAFECLDIVNEKASKLHGILEVAKLLGVQTDEIIGVGDGYNDFPLLMACGLKIAMGNAVPELKAIADFIAPPVEEDGVATVIEKFVLAG